jgi:hypothetical protein
MRQPVGVFFEESKFEAVILIGSGIQAFSQFRRLSQCLKNLSSKDLRVFVGEGLSKARAEML